MNPRTLTLAIVIAAFGALTTKALIDHGFWGILAPHFRSWGAAQVLTDLVIVCLLACLWMFHDAKKQNLPSWPFIALTLAAGSFGPLVYLLIRESRVRRLTP